MSSYQNVDVYVLQRESNCPLHGVLVRVLSEDGTVIYSEAETDEHGHAGFLLWTRRYSLRFYRFQTKFSQPQVIDVLEGPEGTPVPNSFNVYAEVVVPPVANDPKLCRASGYFRDITGAPHRYLDIIFIGLFGPILLQGSGVLSERRAVKTDEKGYACMDLIRCAKYSVTVEGYEDQVRTVLVPDAPSVSLPALLFSTVACVSFDLPSPWTLFVGAEVSLNPTVITSSKLTTHGPDTCNVIWSVEDPTIASLTLLQDRLVLRGLKRGSTRLIASRRDLSIVTVPFYPELHGSGQTITVQ